jgi:hypothetical protein
MARGSSVNSQVAEALRSAPDSVPALWLELRERWEYGHAAGFVFQLTGLCALILSVLADTRETSLGARRDAVPVHRRHQSVPA